MDIGDYLQQLTRIAGDAWMLALVGAFFVMVCESAKPRPTDDEQRQEPRAIALLVTILSLVTPLLLFMHAFISAGRSPEGLMLTIIAIGVAIIGAALVGWFIAAVAAPVGRVLNRAAPLLAVVVFGFTLWVTWRSALEVLNRFVLHQAS
jgi:uncharacterized membrane protein